MVFQPFLIQNATAKDVCGYVNILFGSTEEQNRFALKIIVTDIHKIAKEFIASTADQLAEKTFSINYLSIDDKRMISVILAKMREIKQTFRPVFSSKVEEGEVENVHFNSQTNILTFSYNEFQYKFPLTDMSTNDQLDLTRQMYSNLEMFSLLQSNAMNSLSNQIINKNQIIKKLAYTYCQKMDPFGTRPESVHDLLKNKHISQIFVSRKLTRYLETTVSDAIQQSFKYRQTAANASLELVNPKWEMIWSETVNEQGKHSGSDHTKESETEKVQIKDFGSETDIEETEDIAPSSSTQPTTKRKLQGLLRRNKKRMKTTSSNESVT